MSEEKKQPKQRLNIRVRRGFTWIHDVIDGNGNIQWDLLKAGERRDIEAALRWIAENKQ